MRARKQFVMAVLALPLLTGAAACGELQEAQQGLQQAQENVSQARKGLNTVQTCARATGIAQFTPNFDNPQQARSEARAKAEELGRLAEQTGNQALEQDLRDVQASLEQVASGEITAQNSAQWLQTKLEQTQQVLAACTNSTG
ncbi:hypothetical protein DFQ14_11915 [Halopolyspora algeriensis]|uniref:Small secreted protein n=1 Tax=Halopolyspora algeriensis TaxID=1500506 RepID=A0A368VCH2_9ACTN|nr:hypothetical protein [Halopolyspora algeriensis]RCW38812.1 hypothetical protein DFQ14_11915 [Halopolyspora algeriensis]TQM46676.1 hypothetical protein FHU43_3797 [Halopolyspora algeriensis]